MPDNNSDSEQRLFRALATSIAIGFGREEPDEADFKFAEFKLAQTKQDIAKKLAATRGRSEASATDLQVVGALMQKATLREVERLEAENSVRIATIGHTRAILDISSHSPKREKFTGFRRAWQTAINHFVPKR